MQREQLVDSRRCSREAISSCADLATIDPQKISQVSTANYAILDLLASLLGSWERGFGSDSAKLLGALAQLCLELYAFVELLSWSRHVRSTKSTIQ